MVFLDSGYLVAYENADDQNHHRAREHWASLARDPILVTTSYVLDEVLTFLNARRQHRKAVSIGDRLLDGSFAELIHVDEDLLRRGFDLFRRRPDKRYSLTDCISFLVMRDHQIDTAYAFDDHFGQEGFTRVPQQI
ncbi:MAG: type II toxin-antitoxin system VapC family toxin [Rubrobacteraceae bacterium]